MNTLVLVIIESLVSIVVGASIYSWGYRQGYRQATIRADDVFKQFFMKEYGNE